jgi:transposase
MASKEQISHLQGQLAEALARNSELEARISELEALVLRLSTVKTSKNSHNPPSTDKWRKNQSLREKSDKPVGGQLGHEGNTLKMTETPDVTETIYPNYCNRCGQSLAGFSFELKARRQVIDIPPICPITTEYQSFGTRCSCGHYQCGAFPSGVENHVQYGKNIQSLTVYQSYYQFLPFERLQDFFQNVCRLSIGKGTLENILRRAAQKAQPAYDALKQVITEATSVGSDETSFKSKGSKNWFWVWQNTLVTYIVAAVSRSKDVIDEQFPNGLPNAVLSSDRLAAQLYTTTKAKQVCLSHLIRELNYLIDTEQNPWATNFKTLLKDAIQLKQKNPFYEKDSPETQDIEFRVDQILLPDKLPPLLAEPLLYKQTITFFKQMVLKRNCLFTCLYHRDVPFHNNGSERSFRMVKVKTKISGQFKSLQHEFAVIRSVIDSAIKNGQSVFYAINSILDIPLPPKAAG